MGHRDARYSHPAAAGRRSIVEVIRAGLRDVDAKELGRVAGIECSADRRFEWDGKDILGGIENLEAVGWRRIAQSIDGDGVLTCRGWKWIHRRKPCESALQ